MNDPNKIENIASAMIMTFIISIFYYYGIFVGSLIKG